MPSSATDKPSTARTVHIETAEWERIMQVAFNSKPRRSASDVVREMIDRELSKFESELAAAAKAD